MNGMKRNPVLLVMSAAAGLDALFGATAWADVVGDRPAALCVAGVTALTVGAQFWVRGKVTPTTDPRNDAGDPLEPVDSEGLVDDPILPTEVDDDAPKPGPADPPDQPAEAK